MQFGEVLDALLVGPFALTGYNENIILLKEIQRSIVDACPADLLLDVVEVDEQWILDSEDELNIFICVDKGILNPDDLPSDSVSKAIWPQSGEYLDLCGLFIGGGIDRMNTYMAVMVSAAAGNFIWQNPTGTHKEDNLGSWRGYWTPLTDIGNIEETANMYLVLGSKVGFFCLNWTHGQLQQVIKKVI